MLAVSATKYTLELVGEKTLKPSHSSHTSPPSHCDGKYQLSFPSQGGQGQEALNKTDLHFKGKLN